MNEEPKKYLPGVTTKVKKYLPAYPEVIRQALSFRANAQRVIREREEFRRDHPEEHFKINFKTRRS